MKFTLFGNKVNLDSFESETLKVALLDASKQLEYERSRLDVGSKELTPIIAKINRLEKLKQTLGLDL